ncbi:hypothetical protein DFH27DRAFT_534913 [Peziza echinospora]|nr:hypothetical protein DFH27DRAFT_534913 [Peziza echinospora]
MSFQRLARFAGTTLGSTVIISATAVTGIAVNLVAGYINMNSINSQTMNSLETKTTKLGERLERKITESLERKITESGNRLERVLETTRLSILGELQEGMVCVMKGIDGDNSPLRGYLRRVEECKGKNYEGGADCIKG